MPRSITERYELIERAVDLGDSSFLRIDEVRDLNALVDRMTPEDFGPDERLPYFASLWPSARALARFLWQLADVEGPALELGAGLGVAAITLQKRGIETLATDWEPDALALCAHNAAKNGVRVETRLFDWRDKTPIGSFATLVAADVLYEARNVEPLIHHIDAMLLPGGRAFLADPQRPHLATFEQAARDRGFAVDKRAVEPGEIWCLTRRRGAPESTEAPI